MGCWDAISIKATTSRCTPHKTPDLHLPLQRILTSFFLCHFPWIVHCVLHIWSSVGSGEPQILIYSIKLNVSECGCMCLYVCLLCVMRSTHFPPSCWFPCKSWLTPAKSMRPGPFKPKLLLGWDLSDLATFPPLLALYVSFSLIIFFILICFILIIPRSVGCCSCTQGCAGKGEDNRKQSEHVGGSTKVLTWGRKKTPLRSNL